MSYIDILNYDVIIMVISKLKDKMSIENFNMVYNIDKEITWRTLFILNYNTIEHFGSDIKMCYYLMLRDKILLDSYLKIRDVNINAPGSRNNVKVTWDDVYSLLIFNKKLIMSGQRKGIRYLDTSKVEEKLNPLLQLISGDYPTIFDLTTAYQNNYDIYHIMLTRVDISWFPTLLSDFEDNAALWSNYIEFYTPEENVEDMTKILKDLKMIKL